jgi:hypothetical protein
MNTLYTACERARSAAGAPRVVEDDRNYMQCLTREKATALVVESSDLLGGRR